LDGDAFKDKRILLISNASGARGAMQAAQELSIVPTTMSGSVHNRIIGTCKADFTETEHGLELTEESIRKRCQEIVAELS
jgi:NAD(P)H-dependent FMN reductase